MQLIPSLALAALLATSADARAATDPSTTYVVLSAPGFLDVPPDPERPPVAALSPAEVEVELAHLREAWSREVTGLAPDIVEREAQWVRLAAAALSAAGQVIDRPQLVIVVDRSPRVQELCIVVARPEGPWQVVAGAKISTGQPGRFDHFITPVGVFLNTEAVLGYRAEGTFNENHIRGLGRKGMRVWDFGWQRAVKAWRLDREEGEMRLLMHATDPDRLERRLGHQASQGCIRIPATMNRFLDRHGVIDADYERAAAEDPRFRALLAPDRTPTPLAGNALIVVDSSLAP